MDEFVDLGARIEVLRRPRVVQGTRSIDLGGFQLVLEFEEHSLCRFLVTRKKPRNSTTQFCAGLLPPESRIWVTREAEVKSKRNYSGKLSTARPARAI